MTYSGTKFEVAFLTSNSLGGDAFTRKYFFLDFHAKLTQYPLQHVTYSGTKFKVATSNGLGGDACTKGAKEIIFRDCGRSMHYESTDPPWGGGGGEEGRAQYSVLKLNVSNYKARLLADHFLDPKVHSDGFVNNKPVFDRNLTFIDHVWGPGWWLRANQQAYIIDVLA